MKFGKASLRRLTGLLLFLGTWALVTNVLELFRPILLPSPTRVVAGLIELATGGALFSGGLYGANLFGHTLISLQRVVIGFVVATAAAFPIGLALGSSQIVNKAFGPVIEFARQIPPIAFVPLAIVWFGLGQQPIIFIIFVGAFWAVLLNVITGIHQVPDILKRAARSQGASRIQVFFKVTLRASLPHFVTGLRLGMGTAWISIVAAELIAATSGLGYMIMHARRLIASEHVIGGMLIIGLIGFAFDAGFKRFERQFVR